MGLDTAPVGDTEIRAWGQEVHSIAAKNKRNFYDAYIFYSYNSYLVTFIYKPLF